MRIVIIIAAVLVVCAGAYGTFVWLTPETQSPSATSTPQDSFGGLSGGQFTIRTTDGQSLKIPDFRGSMASTKFEGETYYSLTNNEEEEGESALFDIEYSSDDSLSVFLLREPLGQARLAAEIELRKFFPLSNEDLCKISITVGTPVDVSEQFSGQNLGLSFCSGSIALPN